MTDLAEVECPNCGESSTVLLPSNTEPAVAMVDGGRSLSTNVDGAVWTRCEQGHEFLVYYH